jgi:iron complex transport system ATP-binding protein
MTARQEPLLEAESVTVARHDRCVLNAVSAAFYGGEWTAIVGPNGAGKSTLLATLAGFLSPCSGSIRLRGRPLGDWSLRERAQRLAWLGQSVGSEGDIAAREVVLLGRLPRYGLLGTPDGVDAAAADAALREIEAEAFSDRRIGELSGGERQRVLLARVFATSADTVLLDEPTVHLDVPHQRRLVQSLGARTRAGAAIVSALHDLTLALAADRLIVLADGRLQVDGSPGDPAVQDVLMSVFDHAITIEQVGSPERLNWAAVPSF